MQWTSCFKVWLKFVLPWHFYKGLFFIGAAPYTALSHTAFRLFPIKKTTVWCRSLCACLSYTWRHPWNRVCDCIAVADKWVIRYSLFFYEWWHAEMVSRRIYWRTYAASVTFVFFWPRANTLVCFGLFNNNLRHTLFSSTCTGAIDHDTGMMYCNCARRF